MERGAASPNNLAPYSYTWNNPVVLRDPDGRQVVPPMVESFEPYETERSPFERTREMLEGPDAREERIAQETSSYGVVLRGERLIDAQSMRAEPGFEPIGRTPEEDARHMSIAPPPEPQEAISVQEPGAAEVTYQTYTKTNPDTARGCLGRPATTV